MAYTEEQKRGHVRELQTFLHGLSHTGDLPHVIPDGDYGTVTAAAVRQFQQENQMPATGETDTATWQALAETYQQTVKIPTAALSIFPTGIRRYALGDTGAAVYLLQAVLLSLRQTAHLPPVESSGTYDEKTMQAVQAFQRYTDVPVTGTVDPPTWNLLLAAMAPRIQLIWND